MENMSFWTRAGTLLLAPGWALLEAATFNANFNDGQVPAGAQIFGNAVVEAGGVGDTPCLKLTKNSNSEQGSIVIEDLDGGAYVYGFRATFLTRVGGGTSVPADGRSLCVAPDIPDGAWGEAGVGTGLRVQFDTYDNGTTEVAPEISIRYRSNDVATRPFDISVLRTGDAFERIGVRVNRAGTLDLYYGDTAVYRGRPLPDFTPFGAGRFGWGARTGGLNDNHWMDDIRIAMNTQPEAAPVLSITSSGGDVVIRWTGGGTLQTTTALPGGLVRCAGCGLGVHHTRDGCRAVLPGSAISVAVSTATAAGKKQRPGRSPVSVSLEARTLTGGCVRTAWSDPAST